jgi:hypothetical protein
MQSLLYDDELSDKEIVDGLKAALNIGTEKAVDLVSQPDGYLMDPVIKILLPSEFNDAIEKLRNAPGGEQIYKSTISSLVDDLIEALNRAASDAAPEAVPIFKNAVTTMSITDGWSILKGDYKNAGDQSATAYFKDKTQPNLYQLFQPKIDRSLDKPLIGNTSANKLWDAFIASYNKIYKSPANILLKLEPVKDPDLSSYVTRKALDGLFQKVAEEEKEIREDPYKYADTLIRKVFGNSSVK